MTCPAAHGSILGVLRLLNQGDKCEHCGATENLMKCTQCSSAVYCSKECQIASWPGHKFFCKSISKARTKTCPLDVIGSTYKVAEKLGVRQVKMMMTHVGPVCSDAKEMPAGVPENFLLIHEAATKMAMLGAEKRMYGEREYKRVYDDLVANEQEWLEVSVYLIFRPNLQAVAVNNLFTSFVACSSLNAFIITTKQGIVPW